MARSRSLLYLAFVIAAVSGGCTPQTETVKLYEDVTSVSTPYTRLLVVDVASDADLRRNFENEIVSRLKKIGSDAVASHTLLKNNDGLLQDDIERVSRETTSDGILITHMVSLETDADNQEGREEIIRTCRQGNPVDYFLYDNVVIKEPDSVRLALTVVVVSNLYDARTGNRVWTIQSTCFRKASLPEALSEESKAIVRQLKTDGLI